MRRSMRIGMLAALVSVGVAMSAGCASSGGRGEATGTSLGKAAAAVDAGQGQIDAVLAVLTDLTKNPQSDLRPQFKAYQQSLSKLASTAKDVASKAERMKKEGRAYFDKWDRDLAAITDEGVRARSEDRRNQIQQEFDSIAQRYDEAAAQFRPFMQSLRDIETALRADLTLGGVRALEPVVARAGTEAVKVKEALSRLTQDFRDLSGALSPVGG